MLQKKIDLLGTMKVSQTPVLRLAVCGEVNSGKSTVVNTLLRARILPDNIGRASRPVVIASYRETPGIEIVQADGTVAHFDTLDPVGQGADLIESASVIRVWSDQAHLSGLEIIEVPMTKAEELTEDQIALIRASDVMVWVTIASQAWRLTEKTIVEKLGDARPAQAILAVTRADKLRSKRDQARLKERIERETAVYFSHNVFVRGAPRSLGTSAKSEAAWAKTGGTELISMLREIAPLNERVVDTPEEEAVNEAVTEPVDVVDFAAFRAQVELAEPKSEREAPAKPATATVTTIEERAAQPANDLSSEVQRDMASLDTASLDKATEEKLTALIADLPGVIVSGLCPKPDAQAAVVLRGDATQARQVGVFCRRLQQNLSQTLSHSDETGGVSSLNFSTKAHRILLLDVAQVGLLYMMLDADAMSQGSAQSALSRLSRAFGSEV